MISSTSTQDGALGFQASDGPVYIVGPATLGPTDAVQSFGDPSTLYSTYGSGKLPDRTAFHYSVKGGGPTTCLRIAASTSGSINAFATAIATALAGNNAGNAFAGLSFTGPRNVVVTFAANYDGGNVTITGTAADKVTTQTEVITANAGNDVVGLKVFGTITGIAKGAVGANAATATPKYGNKTAAGASSDSALAFAGTPTEDLDVYLRITRDGDVSNAPYPAYVVSYDGNDSTGAETAVPNGGALTLANGLTATLVGAAVKVGDTFHITTKGPISTSGDLTAALAVLSTLNNDGGELHLVGALTGSQVASVISWRGTERSAGRDWQVYCEARDFNTGETKAQYIAALQSDVAALLDTEGGVTWTPGWWETVLPGGRGIQRRSFAWAIVSQCWRLPYWEHPSSEEAGGGALLGLYTALTPIAPNTHDERLTPGLGGSGGRMLTAQSLPGQQGLWFVGDSSGKRSPGTLAGGTSDFSLLMYARIANRCRRAMQRLAPKLLAKRLGTKPDGTLSESMRKQLTGIAEQFLGQALAGAVQGVRVEFSSTEVVKTTKATPYTAFLDVFGYALEVRATVALAPVQ